MRKSLSVQSDLTMGEQSRNAQASNLRCQRTIDGAGLCALPLMTKERLGQRSKQTCAQRVVMVNGDGLCSTNR